MFVLLSQHSLCLWEIQEFLFGDCGIPSSPYLSLYLRIGHQRILGNRQRGKSLNFLILSANHVESHLLLVTV